MLHIRANSPAHPSVVVYNLIWTLLYNFFLPHLPRKDGQQALMCEAVADASIISTLFVLDKHSVSLLFWKLCHYWLCSLKIFSSFLEQTPHLKYFKSLFICNSRSPDFTCVEENFSYTRINQLIINNVNNYYYFLIKYIYANINQNQSVVYKFKNAVN